MIEAEDYNYGNGQTKAQASVMPYLGGAYAGLSGTPEVDYHRTPDGSSAQYRNDANVPMNDNLADSDRGGWNVTTNFKLGWIGGGEWFNYTRTFAAGDYQVLAALSNGGTDPGLLHGTLQKVTSGATTTSQTMQQLGTFDAPGTGSWGRNDLVLLVKGDGTANIIHLEGATTLRFTAGSGDIDYFKFVPIAPPQITQQPTNVTVVEGQSASFMVKVSNVDPMTCQWQRNGVNIPGASNALYYLPAAALSDNGAQFRCVLVNAQGTNTSNTATLTVNPDTTRPAMVTAVNLGADNLVSVLFSEPLEIASATDTTHYSINNGVVVTAANLDVDGRTVVLATSPMVKGLTYTLTVNGVRDRAATPNTIAPNSQRTFSLDYTPLDVSVITGSSETIGPSSRRTGLIISEIMYHPAARTDGMELEFVELFNTQDWPEDISGYRLSGNLDYTFPVHTTIGARGYLVVAAVPADVQSVYGLTGVRGGYTNRLSNGSGTIRLRNRSNAVLLEADYAGAPPYPASADGAGHSLVLARPSYGEADPRAWAASDKVGGSPGQAEITTANPYRTLLINEVLVHTDPPDLDYVELFNYGSQALDISGCFLSDDPDTNKFAIPTGTVIPAKGFIAFDELQLGFGLSTLGETVFFRSADQTRVIDAIRFAPQANGVAFGRYPDGAPTFQALSAKTPGSSNARPLARDIVINELMCKPVSGLDDDEYVELHNHGTSPINVSGWRFRDGIDFTIPTNTIVPASGYLVVAKNAARLLTNYGNLNTANTVGDYKGSLANGGERLTLAMPSETVVTNQSGLPESHVIWIVADQVAYGTGGRWGQWSAGGGSSLELIDPRSDSRLASNWADSDESAKAPWTTVSYTGILDNGSGTADELQILLEGPGECLVDDAEVLDANGVNRVTNSTFESGLGGWVPQGNHDQSSLEPTGYSSARSLHVRALERGDPGANRIRTQLSAPLADATSATIRAKVRWLKGHPEILFRLHGNALEAVGVMALPANPGTPGAANSRVVANTGPAIYGVSHRPVLPAANQAVTVRAQVSDPDGLASLVLKYRVDPATNLTTVAMMYSGAGFYSATIPGQSAGKVVAFHIQAADGAATSATTKFPNDAPTRECLIRFGETQPAGTFGSYRLWLTQGTFNRWSSRLKLDNGDLDATFVYGDQRVVYNIGALYGGSPWISPGYNTPTGNLCGYVFHFPPDDLMLGVTDFTLDWPSWSGELASIAQAEQTAFWMADQLGLNYVYRRFVNLFVNGVRRANIYEDSTQPSGAYVKEWFADDSDGALYKIDDWFEFDDNANKEGNVDATLQKFTTTGGARKLARYRWNWRKRALAGSANDYQDLFTLVDAVNSSPDPVYQSQVQALVEVEQWMRVFALEHAVANWDSYGYNRGKNMFAYKSPHGKWQMLMWDIDCVFQGGYGVTTGLFDANDPTVARMYNSPPFRRAYWRALQEIVDGPMLNANVEPVMRAKYAALLANGISCSPPDPVLSWIAQRRDYIVQQLAAVTSGFAIASNGGNNFSVTNNLLTLTGTAPIGVTTIEVNGIAFPATWTTLTNWTLRIPLTAGPNTLNLQGFDLRGNPIAATTDTITVTYTGGAVSPQDYLVINEIMYNPAVPDAGFVEILNTSTSVTFDLSNYILKGADFTFPEGTIIYPGGFVVVAKDPVVFASTYGSSIPVAGTFSGKLQNNGETLSLVKPGITPDQDIVIDQVRYGGQAPWPEAPNGSGPSLQLIDPRQDNSRVANWAAVTVTTAPSPPQWTFVSVSGTASSSTIYLYLTSAGDVHIDDLSLVAGSVPNVGPNVLQNGSFDTDLSGWTVSANHSLSAISTSVKRTGAGSLHLVATSGGTTRGSSIWQDMTPALTSGATYTLSYWYLPSTNGNGLIIRLSGNGIVSSHPIAPPSSTVSSQYTPGATNSVLATLPSFPTLWINEVQPDNASGLTDRMGEHDPWIELYNSGTSAVNLSGCFLASNYTNLTQWPFPPGATINPGQYMVIWADAQPGQTLGAEWHTNFRLNSSTGAVALIWTQPAKTNALDYLDYAYVGSDRSIGSYPDGQCVKRQIFHYPTPGATNNPASAPVPVVINEWMAGNTRTLADPADGHYDDWFELYNTGTSAVDLSGYYLTDNLTNKTQWAIPAGIHLPPGGYLLVWADNDTWQNGLNGDLHASFQLSKSGEAIGLFAPDGKPIDTVTFAVQTNDISAGRFPDGVGALCFMTTPTPRTANSVPAANQPPALSPIADRTVEEDTLLAFTATASDPDSEQTLTFSLDPGAPTGATINAVSGLFTWTPTEAQGPNAYPITIRVTDSGSPTLGNTKTFNVSVNEVNAPPALAAITDRTLNEGSLLTFTATATDPDLPANTLTYSLDAGAPTGAAIDPKSGLFTWTPAEVQGPGTYPITVRVTDDGLPALADAKTFTVVVNEVNTAPALAAIPDKTLNEETLLTFTVTATDTDLPAQTLTYSLDTGAPAGAAIDAKSGLFTWTPTEAQGPSTNAITIQVTDNGAPALADVKTFTVVVTTRAELKLTSIVLTPEGVATITWTAQKGSTYQVECATDLSATEWNSLEQVTATEATAAFSYSHGETAQRFYRVRWVE